MPARLKSANSLLREVEADLRKQADHAEDRFKERLPSAPPALLSQARQAATRIPPGPEHRLHLPLLENGQVQGFAAYKRVGKRGKPVLATILGPHMEPRDSHLLPSSLLEKAAANRMGKILGAFQRGEGGPQVASQAKALLSHPTTSGVAHAQMAAPKSLYDLHLDSLPLRPMGSPSLLAAEAAVSRDPINLMRALNTRDPGVVAAAAKNPHANPDDLKLVHALRPDFAEANPATHLHRLAHPVPGMTHHQAAAEVRDGARRAIHRSAASELARQRLEMKTATDLTEASRDKIKDKNFALPGRRYPIHDMNHARAALSMVSAHGTPEEKTQVRAAVASRYPGLAERSESIQKEAANRITKIMDQARKLAPASITGTLAPGKQRVLDQAEALMLHPATSAYAEASLHRPKSLFDLHLDGAKPVVGNLPELMAEARNPTTSAPRLAELAGMRHQPLMEAAAVNPAAGAGMEYLHQIRPDLADANPTTDLLRLVNGGSLPKMDPAAFAEIKKQTRRGAELPWTVGNEDGSAVRRFKDARTTLRFSGNIDQLPSRWKGRALENMRLHPLSGGWASDSTHPIILEQMSPTTRRVSEKLYGKIDEIPVGVLQGLTGREVDHSKVAAPAWVKRLRGTLSTGGPSAEILQGVKALPARRVQQLSPGGLEGPVDLMAGASFGGPEGLFARKTYSPWGGIHSGESTRTILAGKKRIADAAHAAGGETAEAIPRFLGSKVTGEAGGLRAQSDHTYFPGLKQPDHPLGPEGFHVQTPALRKDVADTERLLAPIPERVLDVPMRNPQELLDAGLPALGGNLGNLLRDSQGRPKLVDFLPEEALHIPFQDTHRPPARGLSAENLVRKEVARPSFDTQKGRPLPEAQPKLAATKTRIFAGLRVRIDRPKGYVQKGKDAEGNPWERVYKCDYGYLAGTQGGDGDGMDVFLGPDEGADAFLIWQKKGDGSFDEYKLMLGFKDAYQAKAMYLQHVPAKFMGKIERVPVGMLQGLTGKQVDHSKVAAPAWMRKVRQGLVSLGEVAPEVPHLPTRAQARNVGSALKEDPMSVLSAGENSGAEGLTSFRKSVMSPPASEELTPRMRHHIGTTDAFLRDAGDHFVRSTGLPLRISESPPSPAALAEVRAKGYPDHFAIPVTQTDTPIHAHTGGPLARPMGAHEMQEVREMGHLLNPPPTGVAAARTPGTPFTSHLGISPILEENLQSWEIPAWQRAMGSAREEVDGIAMNALGSVGNTPWAPTPHDSRASRGAVRAMEHKHRQLEKLMGGSPDMRNAAAQQRQETVRIGITRGTEGLLERVPPEHREMAEGYLRSSTPEPTRRIFPRET